MMLQQCSKGKYKQISKNHKEQAGRKEVSSHLHHPAPRTAQLGTQRVPFTGGFHGPGRQESEAEWASSLPSLSGCYLQELFHPARPRGRWHSRGNWRHLEEKKGHEKGRATSQPLWSALRRPQYLRGPSAVGLSSPRGHHRPPTTLTVWTWEWTPAACIRASPQLPPLRAAAG